MMKIWVIGHASYDYECCEFVCESFEKKEQAEEAIKGYLAMTDSEEQPIFNVDSFIVIEGEELNYKAKSRIIDNVKIE